MRKGILLLSVVGITACVSDGWENLPRRYVEASFQSLQECEKGVEYLIATDKRRDAREAASPTCFQSEDNGYTGRYLQLVEFRDNTILFKKSPDSTWKVETPTLEEVNAYFAKKTETVDAQAQTKRK